MLSIINLERDSNNIPVIEILVLLMPMVKNTITLCWYYRYSPILSYT